MKSLRQFGTYRTIVYVYIEIVYPVLLAVVKTQDKPFHRHTLENTGEFNVPGPQLQTGS